ncbi:SLC13 family permease [Halobacterium bonnevillei]|uniref:SLC13 family permease n=1 Tax=Halobacterium bonnevillei TaxID=2692200 RepID=A0A6B0SSE5_9EURY|nr:SLC13 family permease [Halobacterium bonnevillei]MXR20499.1 SLC13 family permease [Halobacterium bonnevillei]
MVFSAVSVNAAVVFLLILAAVVLFATEFVPPDVTAIVVIVALVVLQPWTGVETTTAFSGFSNVATITVAAMYMLSEGIHRTGIVRRLGDAISGFAAGSEERLRWTTLSLSGGLAGVVNNTPIVAVFIPMVLDLADEYRISPSKLLMPVSFAAMLGGTLTLVGTSANLLASSFSDRLLGHPFSMFEFTHLGLLGLIVGVVYLATVGQRLLPERVRPTVDLLGEFNLKGHITRLYVRDESPLVGSSIREGLDDVFGVSDGDVLEVVRYDGRHAVPDPEFELESGDVVTVRGDPESIRAAASNLDLWYLPWVHIDQIGPELSAGIGTLVEARITEASSLVGERVGGVDFRQSFEATLLGIQRGETTVTSGFSDIVLEAGDVVLLRSSGRHVAALRENPALSVTTVATEGFLDRTSTTETYREDKQWLAVAIVAGVVGVAALGFVSIGISALAGVVAMIAGGALETDEAYDAVAWDVIFLLAGMIPLGIALERSGGAALVADLIVTVADVLPAVAMIALFYIVTAVVTNLISNNATIVLFIPVAVDVATQLGANAFSFVLAVTFAASTSFLTPVGYQTNLMVYGPGGYEFTDYLRLGGPLQLVLAGVTTFGIWLFWGV